ncbi:ribosome maturation protein, partial [Lactifluus volemus]
MGKSITKVVYKPDPNTSDVFLVVVNPEEYKRWKEGAYNNPIRTIPLVNVVDSFEILSSNQGPQGLLGRPSKQELDNVFGTHVDIDVIHQILENGKDESGESI